MSSMQSYYPLSHQEYCDILVGKRPATERELTFIGLVRSLIESDPEPFLEEGETCLGEALTPDQYYWGAEFVCNHDPEFE